MSPVHDLSVLGDIQFEWSELKSIGYSVSFRKEGKKKETCSFRFYISSAKLSAEEFAYVARAHWSIEVKLHWKLDTAFNEDACRIRRENSDENLAMIRHTAINLLKNETTFKVSMKRKLKKANRNTSYVEKVLVGRDLS